MITLLTPPAAKAAAIRSPAAPETAGSGAAGDTPGAAPFSALLNQACATDALPGGGADPGHAGLIPATGETGLLAGDEVDARSAPADGGPTPEMLLAMLSDAQTAVATVLPDAAQAGAAAAAAATTLQHFPPDGTSKLPVHEQATPEAALPLPDARADARTPGPSGLTELARRPASADDTAGRLAQASTPGEPPGYARAAAEALSERGVASASATPAGSAPAALPGATPMLATPGAARAEPAAPATITIGTPVGNPYFGEETAQHVSWLVGNGIEQARINVHPADLGPIEIRISMNNSEAIISFAVTQPETSAAIEDAMPRLREMLAESGISLGQTSVGGEGTGFDAPAGESASDRQLRLASTERLRDEAAAADTRSLAVAAERVATRNGMVDLFA